MKKSEFLRILKDSLMGMTQNDKREIMLDYEKHFIDGLAQGRTEEEICEALGDPKQIALNLKRNMQFNSQSTANDGVNTAAYVIGIIALSIGCIWLVSVLIGLVLGAVSTIYATIALSTVFSSQSLLMVVIAGAVFAVSVMILIVLGIIKLIPYVMRWYKTMLNGLTSDPDRYIKKEYKGIKISPVIWILLVVVLLVSLGFTIIGSVVTAKEFAENFDSEEFSEDIDEFTDKFGGWIFFHRWAFHDGYRYYDYEEFEYYMDEFEDTMDEFSEELEDLEEVFE